MSSTDRNDFPFQRRSVSTQIAHWVQCLDKPVRPCVFHRESNIISKCSIRWNANFAWIAGWRIESNRHLASQGNNTTPRMVLDIAILTPSPSAMSILISIMLYMHSLTLLSGRSNKHPNLPLSTPLP